MMHLGKGRKMHLPINDKINEWFLTILQIFYVNTNNSTNFGQYLDSSEQLIKDNIFSIYKDKFIKEIIVEHNIKDNNLNSDELYNIFESILDILLEICARKEFFKVGLTPQPFITTYRMDQKKYLPPTKKIGN